MGYLRNKKKKEEERDLPNIEGSRARMEWDRKEIRGNKLERKRFYREFKKKREDELVFQS
jgi:hypothetical protein